MGKIRVTVTSTYEYDPFADDNHAFSCDKEPKCSTLEEVVLHDKYDLNKALTLDDIMSTDEFNAGKHEYRWEIVNG